MKSANRNFAYFLSLLPAILVLIGNLNGGILSWLNLFFTLGFLALAEIILPSIKSNNHSSSKDILPDLVLLLHCVFQTLTLSSLIYGIHLGYLQNYSLIGSIISTGIYSGQGAIIIAHELIHKHQKWKRMLGRYLLFTAGNFYFEIHHLRIHHKFVGTLKDAATARLNESFYSFLFRTIYGQIKQAWDSEKQLLIKNDLKVISFNNGLLNRIFFQLIWIMLLLFVGGKLLAIAWISCSTIAIILLEYVNYIEHYGLSRTENKRISIADSWQTNKLVSRFFLIDLSRHADHHFHANKPYHTLQSHDQSPSLPGGYASLIIPALIPPLWFQLVNKRIPKYEPE